MSSMTTIEKRHFEDLFAMQGGYVLDFSNASFASFFRSDCGIDIYEETYAFNGESKANRLRAFWERCNDVKVGEVLRILLCIWRDLNPETTNPQTERLYSECQKTVLRLLGKETDGEETEEDFLKKDFGKVSLAELPLAGTVLPILESRIREAYLCHNAQASLSAIFMCGSVLEGLLLGMAQADPKRFNQAGSSPKKPDGKPRPFHEWKLGELIDVAHDVGLLRLDVQKFSHFLRDFRNYIHPYQQMCSNFSPDTHTASICLQVLKAAIASLKEGSIHGKASHENGPSLGRM